MRRTFMMRVAAFLLGAAMLAGCAAKPAAAPYMQRQSRSAVVETAVVKKGEIGSTVVLSGQVDANVLTAVTPQQSGKVAEIFVNVGDHVKTGQPLLQLDTTDLKLQLAQQQASLKVAEAQYEKAKSDAQKQYDEAVDAAKTKLSQTKATLTQARTALQDAQAGYTRAKALFDSGAISQQELDNAKTVLENAQAKYDDANQQYKTASKPVDPINLSSVKVSAAQLEQARANLASLQNQIALATVRAPIDGTIASRSAEVGSYVGGQTAVVNIAQIDPVKVKIMIPESRIGKIKAGLPVEVTVQSAGEQTFKASVTRISPVEDDSAKAYPAEIVIPNPDGVLKPGMVAQVTVTGITPRQAIVIPASAMVQTPDGPKVFTVVNGEVHQQLIKVGEIESEQIEVTEGLNEGDTIVTSGQDTLSEGMTIASPGDAGDKTGPQGAGSEGVGKGRGTPDNAREEVPDGQGRSYPGQGGRQ
jgi:multidrug efflux pump subunit AcrA (membrane-fusion protein)